MRVKGPKDMLLVGPVDIVEGVARTGVEPNVEYPIEPIKYWVKNIQGKILYESERADEAIQWAIDKQASEVNKK